MGLFSSRSSDTYKIKKGVCTVEFNEEGKLTKERAQKVFSTEKVRNCQSYEIYIGKGVTSIDEGAFWGNPKITEITVGESVEDIALFAFERCKALKSISVDKNNKKYKSVNGDLYSKNGKVFLKYAPNKSDSFFTTGDEVELIVPCAFSSTSSLETVEIGKRVAKISERSFFLCQGLRSIVVAQGNEEYRSIDGNLYSHSTLMRYAPGKPDKEFKVPVGVETIGQLAFFSCPNLTRVTLSRGIGKIETLAFKDCPSLSEVVVPDSVATIEFLAFSGCSSLTVCYEAEQKPQDRTSFWYDSNQPAVWGYKIEGVRKRMND